MFQPNIFGQGNGVPQSQLGPMVIASKQNACVGTWTLVCGCSEPGGTLRGAAVVSDLYTFLATPWVQGAPSLLESPEEGLHLT